MKPGRETRGVEPGTEAREVKPGRETRGVEPGTEAREVKPGNETRGVEPGNETRGVKPGTETKGALQWSTTLDSISHVHTTFFWSHEGQSVQLNKMWGGGGGGNEAIG